MAGRAHALARSLAAACQRRFTGLAGRLLAELVDWGRARGARAVYLQVAADNEAALAMYRRADFAVHHDDRYVEAPAADTDQG